MCLIIFSYRTDSVHPLVVAANRDEFFSRPTQQAAFWTQQPGKQQVLAGRDLLAGGTWLGITRGGRFAAVTNVRDPSQVEQTRRSRGELPLNFLQGTLSAEDYCTTLQTQFDQYAGYNLLVGDGENLYYVNNLEQLVTPLQAGVYGLSNGALDSPWPKVKHGRKQLQALLSNGGDLSIDALLTMMNNRELAADEDLPDTGLPLELERQLSSTFIAGGEREYGTRCSTAIIIASDGECTFSEQNYDLRGEPAERRHFEFNRGD